MGIMAIDMTIEVPSMSLLVCTHTLRYAWLGANQMNEYSGNDYLSYDVGGNNMGRYSEEIKR